MTFPHALALGTLTLSLLGPGLSAQTPAEGPLENDTFVPTNPALEELLENGDALWWQSRQGNQDPASLLARAMDLWQSTLLQEPEQLAITPEQGAFAWVRGLTGERFLARCLPERAEDLERLWLSPSEAVWIRLEGMPQPERTQWRQRFEPLAQEALQAAPYNLPRLVWIDRMYPGTQAAAIACLRLADAQLEQGSPIDANTFLARGQRHLGERASEGAWSKHFEARQTDLENPTGESPPKPQGSQWKQTGVWRLESRRGRLAPGERPSFGLGPRPGLIPLPDGGLCVQTPRALWWLKVDALGQPAPGFPQIEDLSQWTSEGPIRPITPRSSGGWPHLPLLQGRRVFLVVDRAKPGSDRFGLPVPPRGNHLLALDRGTSGGSSLAWIQNSSGLAQGAGAFLEELAPDGHFEWQPGPVISGNKVWILARSMAPVGEDNAQGAREEFLFLMALNTDTGKLLSQIRLHKGSDLSTRDEASMTQAFPTACQPLGLQTDLGQLLVQTGQGFCAILDANDGRPRFAYKTRRRAPRDAGWPGSYRPKSHAGIWSVTPFDSDRLYEIDTRRGQWPIRKARPMGSRLALLGVDDRGKTFFGRRGARQTIWTEPFVGAPHLAFLFGRQEVLAGAPARLQNRLWISTNVGLYGLDRSRELMLTERIPLEDLGAGVGGDVWRTDAGLWVLGADTLWLVQAR